jgi:dihydrofolate synthase/folylpolyglutamate synthase
MAPADASFAAEYAAVQDYLFGLKAKGLKFGIDRMRLLAAALGHPERQVPVVHLAGTNGKGSTSALLDAIFHAAGWRTGLYTSPHLVKLGERVQVDRRILSEAEIVAYVRELRPVAEALARGGPDDHPSFFEFMTAMAFLQFARRRCDVAIVEVGLGGRLDATNVVEPEITVITSIGLDHCEILGDRLEQIAAEKAGIIKPARPVVIGRMPAVAEQVIRERAASLGAPLVSVREVFGDDVGAYPETNLEGEYQRWNAATATLVARQLDARWRLTPAAVAKGLRHADWPGRWQRTRLGGRLLVLDASHNPEGAAVLADNLAHLVAETGRAPVAVVGVLGMVRAQPLIEVVCRFAKELHFVVPAQARACSHEQLEALVPADFRGRVVRATVAGLFPEPQVCTAGGADDVLVVTGSIYLIGEVMARLEPARGAIESRLQDF